MAGQDAPDDWDYWVPSAEVVTEHRRLLWARPVWFAIGAGSALLAVFWPTGLIYAGGAAAAMCLAGSRARLPFRHTASGR